MRLPRIQDLFPTFAKLLGKNSNPSYTRSTHPYRPHKQSEFEKSERSELNGLDDEGNLDQYEVYKLDQLGADIPEQYRTWE